MGTRIALAVVLALATVACGSDSEPDLGTGAVFIQEVEVIERDGEYVAVIVGWYPDACSTFGGSRQEVDGDTVILTVASDPGTGELGCAQVLTDMREEIPLDVSDLDPGEYTLIANEEAMTTFTVS